MNLRLPTLFLLLSVCCWQISALGLQNAVVDCVNTTQALLFVKKSYAVTLPKGCQSKNVSGTYTLTEECLGDEKVFVVYPKRRGEFSLSGGKSTSVFSVTCIPKVDQNGANVKATTNINVKGVPEHDHLLVERPQVDMYLTKGNPNISHTGSTSLSAGETVSLGDKLYLVIESPRNDRVDIYLPETCEASSSPPLNLTIPIWDRRQVEQDCIKEPTLMDRFTVFPQGIHYPNNTSYNMAFAPVYTFTFDQMYVHSNQITYTCSFLVCPTGGFTTSTSTSIEEDGAPLNRCAQRMAEEKKCLNVVQEQSRRRRREVASHPDKDERKTLSVSVLVQQSGSNHATGVTPETTVVILVGVFIPIIIIMVIIIVIILYSESRRRKKKKQPIGRREFEMTVTRQIA